MYPYILIQIVDTACCKSLYRYLWLLRRKTKQPIHFASFRWWCLWAIACKQFMLINGYKFI